MNDNEILLDALGGLFGGIVHAKKTQSSKELTFDEYSDMSLGSGVYEDIPNIKSNQKDEKE